MSEPLKLIAGDTWSWTRPGADRPASAGWTLTYYLTLPGDSTVKNLEATPAGDDFQVDVDAASSAAWAPGLWAWSARLSNGTETHTVDHGQIRVLADPANVAASLTHARKCLTVVEAALEKCMGDAVVEYTIDGTTFKKNRTELLNLRTFYREEVRQEQAALQGKAGVKVMKVSLR